MSLCYNCFQEKETGGPCPHCGFDAAGQEEKYPLALKPGSILNGRYVVGRVLGQGGFGVTYIALDDRTKERVAIKEYLPTELAGRKGATSVQIYSGERMENFLYGREQFLQEAKTLSNFIGDEHIVRVHSYFEENGTAYFAMEYVAGKPVDKYMREFGGRLSVEEAARLLLPLMESLGHVHAAGIIHRDIAPDNILVQPNGVAKLLDFGAARYSTGEKSKSLDVILKHGFAPKEQYARRGRQGPYTDVYALGATFYYALTGKIPPEAIERMDEDDLIPPSTLGVKISAETEEVLLKALEVSAQDRWQTMGEFHRAMENSLAGQVPTPDPVPKSDPTPTPVPKSDPVPTPVPKSDPIPTPPPTPDPVPPVQKQKRKSGKAGSILVAIAAFMIMSLIGRQVGGHLAEKTKPTPGITIPAVSIAPPAQTLPVVTAAPVETPAPIPEPTPAPTESTLNFRLDGTILTVSGSGKAEPAAAIPDWDEQRGKITQVRLQEGVTAIGDEAFSGCGSLNTVLLPASLTMIGENAFAKCWDLNTFELAADSPAFSLENGLLLTKDGRELLWVDRDMSGELILPDGLTAIRNGALLNCGELTSVTVPEGVTRLGERVFYNCYAMESLRLPASLTQIGDRAFYNCDDLYDVAVPESSPSFRVEDGLLLTKDGRELLWADRTMSGELNLPEGLAVIRSAALLNCKLLTSVTVPEGVTEIGDAAFKYCYALSELRLPASLAALGEEPFTSCSNLNITLGETNAAFTSKDGMLLTKDGRELLWVDAGKEGELVLPSGLTTVRAWAASNCRDLTTVTIPEGVTSIGERAFTGCRGLMNVTLPAGLTEIGNSAFGNCELLMSVTLPASLTQIGDNPFSGCSALKSLTVSGSNPGFRLENGLLLTKDGQELIWTDPAKEGDLLLPAGITRIRSSALVNCRRLTSVTLPEGVTDIGGSAFSNCENLKYAALPSSVKTIGYNAFAGCYALRSLTLPEGVTELGSGAFTGCSALTDLAVSDGNTAFRYENGLLLTKDGRELLWAGPTREGELVLPAELTTIRDSAFHDNSRLTIAVIPEGVTYIGNSAFDNCGALRSVTLPSSLRHIGNSAFDNCASLTVVSFPEGLKSIGSFAFYNCAALESAAIPESVVRVGERAFSNCSALRTVTLPSRLTYLKDATFNNCSSLSTVTIPDGVRRIGQWAFGNCEALTSVSVPAGVKRIGDFGFYSSSALTSVTLQEGLAEIGKNCFAFCDALSSLTLPSSLERIGDEAFWYCRALTKLTIPEHVTELGSGVFSNCDSLQGLEVSDSNTSFYIRSGLLLTKDGKELIWCDPLKEGELVLPAGLTTIRSSALRDCGALTSVTIPEGVTSIGEEAFSWCNKLRSLTIPNSLERIGDEAFYYCRALESLSIPQNVTYLGDNLFNSCHSLSSLKVSDSNPSFRLEKGLLLTKDGTELIWCDPAKEGDLNLPNGLRKIRENAFEDCERLTRVTVPESVTSIGEYAFSSCSALRSVTLPASLRKLDYGVFSYCSSLTSLTIPEGVVSIEGLGFSGCKSLTAFQVAENNPAFRSVNGLLLTKDGRELVCVPSGLAGTLILPAGITSIRTFAIYNCASLEKVSFPDGVRNIPSYTCNGKALLAVTLPASVTHIEKDAFNNCTELSDVYYAGSESDWNKIGLDASAFASSPKIHYNSK